MGAVVQQPHLLLAAAGAGELAPRVPVADRDRQGGLRGGARPARDAHPSAHQRAEHGEEPSGGVGDGAGVGAVLGDRPVPAQKRRTRHLHPVEGQAAVVDAVQPGLGAAVPDRHPGQRAPLFVPDRHQQGVHPVVLAQCAQTGEDHRRAPVPGGVADVVLAGRLVRGVHGERFRPGVVAGGGAEPLHVGAVPGLGHGEAAGQVQRDHPGQVLGALGVGAQRLDRAAEQAPLHPDLDHQGHVGDEHLEGHARGAEVARAADLAGEAVAGHLGAGEGGELVGDARPVLLHGQPGGGGEALAPHLLAHGVPDPGPPAVQEGAQRLCGPFPGPLLRCLGVGHGLPSFRAPPRFSGRPTTVGPGRLRPTRLYCGEIGR